MKQLVKTSLLALVFLGTASLAETTDNKAIQMTNPAKSIQVVKDQPEFTIKLRSNATTGYAWFIVNYDKQLMTVESHSYHAPDAKVVGAAGYQLWKFKAKPGAFIAPQMTSIEMSYTKPWDAEDSTSIKLTVMFH